MINRTFKQRGQGHGSSPVTVVVKIDGVEVYNGAVPTLDTPYKLTDFDPDYGQPGADLFSWNDELGFEGTKTMEITVGNGFLVMMDTMVNYTFPGTTPDRFGPVYMKTVGEVTNTNPLVDISINGAAQDQDNGCPGQTYWLVPPSGTFTCTVRISSSSFIPPTE